MGTAARDGPSSEFDRVAPSVLRDTGRAMSQKNVELVRKLFEVYNERSFEENADLIDPEMDWDMSRIELPDGTSYTGPEEFRHFIEAWEEGFGAESMEAQEMIDAGSRVVVVVHHRG